MSSYKERWGYGGIETAINGLTLWLDKNFEFTGNADQRSSKQCRLIVKYGEENIPGFKQVGHLIKAADYVAKKIDKNNKFQHFTDWVRKQLNS